MTEPSKPIKSTDTLALLTRSLKDHLEAAQRLLESNLEQIMTAGELIRQTLHSGNKILICGNGGSAADAQHLAAELVGRFERERRALPAFALATNTSTLTAIGNDYSYEAVFARQLEGLSSPGDVAVAISTSGKSPNVINAVRTARKIGLVTVGMTGLRGDELAAVVDYCIRVPSERTSRIQEAHILIGHILCEIVDENFAPGRD